FLAVAESGSFSQASHQLHVTQPAVTKRIKALEQLLGVQVFDRVGKRVFLTQAGEVLQRQAEQMLAMLQDTERQLRNLSDAVTGELRMATSHHIGLHRLAPVLRAFTSTYPDVQLNLSFEDSEVAHGMARQGEIELAVVTLNPAGDPYLQYAEVWQDPLVFTGSGQLQGAYTMQELAELPCVLPGMNTYTGRIVSQRFAEAGIALQPTMSTNYLETIGMLVSVGLGWSVLPRSMLGDLHLLEVDCPAMTRTLGCVTNPQRAMSNAAQAFVEVLDQHA
ncbi:MAG: LysR family transcriptional regulator, partial [Pseudomonadota bacterium]